MADQTTPDISTPLPTMAAQTSSDTSTPLSTTTAAESPAPPTAPSASTTASTLQVPAAAHTAPHTTGPPRTLADTLQSYHARATPEQQRDWAVVAPHIAAAQQADRPLMFVASYVELAFEAPAPAPAPPAPAVRSGGSNRQRGPAWYFVAIVTTVCVGCIVGVGIAWMQSRWAPGARH